MTEQGIFVPSSLMNHEGLNDFEKENIIRDFITLNGWTDKEHSYGKGFQDGDINGYNRGFYDALSQIKENLERTLQTEFEEA